MTAVTLAEHWSIIQAVARGVTDTARLADVAPGGYYRLVRPPAGVEPSRTLRFARDQVGAKYGYLSDASIAVEILPPDWLHFPIRRPGTWICSALGAEALRFGGWYHPWPDVYQATPSQVLHALLDSGGVEIPVGTARPGDVGFCHSKGLIGAAIRLAQHGTEDATYNHCFILDKFVPTKIATLHPAVELPTAA